MFGLPQHHWNAWKRRIRTGNIRRLRTRSGVRRLRRHIWHGRFARDCRRHCRFRRYGRLLWLRRSCCGRRRARRRGLRRDLRHSRVAWDRRWHRRLSRNRWIVWLGRLRPLFSHSNLWRPIIGRSDGHDRQLLPGAMRRVAGHRRLTGNRRLRPMLGAAVIRSRADRATNSSLASAVAVCGQPVMTRAGRFGSP